MSLGHILVIPEIFQPPTPTPTPQEQKGWDLLKG